MYLVAEKTGLLTIGKEAYEGSILSHFETFYFNIASKNPDSTLVMAAWCMNFAGICLEGRLNLKKQQDHVTIYIKGNTFDGL